MTCFPRLVLLLTLALSASGAVSVPAVNEEGGGSANGFVGAYFANESFAGEPVFTRRDRRIDFRSIGPAGWGGSRSGGYRTFPADRFSVRWTGQVLTGLTGTYRLRTWADDGVRVRVKQPHEAAWRTVIEDWPAAARAAAWAEGTFAAEAGATWDVQVEYRELTGNQTVRLLWTPPGRPETVVEPVALATLNWASYSEQTPADAILSSRGRFEGGWGLTAPGVDADGWPTGDGALIVSEMFDPYDPSPLEIGRMRLTFTGQANETLGWGNLAYVAGSKTYDAATNTTTALFDGVDNNSNVTVLRLLGTRRTPASALGSGVTNIRLMRPTAPGATTTLPEDMLFHPAGKAALSRFTGMRYIRVNDQARQWSERTQPTAMHKFGRRRPYVYGAEPVYGGDGTTPAYDLQGDSMMAHEYEIMLCNELGCDLFMSVPHLLTTAGADSYARKLALLVRHGSDASGEPYATPQANPYHPPLNPNLHVYLEIGNETWNWGNWVYSPWFDGRCKVKELANTSHPDFALINYDGAGSTPDANGYRNAVLGDRLYTLTLKQVSDVFRTVWGDGEMPGGANRQPRVRPYLSWQYGNGYDRLLFMEHYFNNGDGVAHVATPRPPSWYFHSAGGAGYYSSTNRDGRMSGILPNPGCESPVLAAGGSVTRPTGTGLVFSGEAGICRVGGANPMPQPMEGQQAAWVRGTGSVSFSITAPAVVVDGTTALCYRWVRANDANDQTFRITANGVDITPDGPAMQPRTWDATNEWRRFFWWQGNYYFTKTFAVSAGQTVTIRFEGLDATGTKTAYLDDLFLASADAFYAGGIPDAPGAAFGGSSEGYSSYQYADGRWCALFGLSQATYEHGFSSGGDSGESPMQQYVRYQDPRAARSVLDAMAIMQQAGGRLAGFGVYTTWPGHEVFGDVRIDGVFEHDRYPLAQGIDQALARLPAAPDHGPLVPCSLPIGYPAQAGVFADTVRPRLAGDWTFTNWVGHIFSNLTPGVRRLSVTTTTSDAGTYRVFIGATEVLPLGAAGGTRTADLDLPAGVLGLRVVAGTGTTRLTAITITMPDAAPPAPAASVALLRDGHESGPIDGVARVTLAAPSSEPVTVLYRIGGTATYHSYPPHSDYTMSIRSRGTLRIPAGATSADIVITPRADSTVEADETVTITLLPGTGYELGAATVATITIRDGTAAVATPVVRIQTVDPRAAVPGDTGLLRLGLQGTITQPLAVAYGVGGSAPAAAFHLGWSPGVATVRTDGSGGDIVVAPRDDTLYRRPRTVAITLQPGAGYTLGTPSSASVELSGAPLAVTGGTPTAATTGSVSLAVATNSAEAGWLEAAWDFGDGTTASGGLAQSTTWSTPGTRRVRVTVRDPQTGASAVYAWDVAVAASSGSSGGAAAGGGGGGCGAGALGLLLLACGGLGLRRRQATAARAA